MKYLTLLALFALIPSISFANLQGAIGKFKTQLRLSRQNASKAEYQTAYNKSKEQAKTLLGIVQGVDIGFLSRLDAFQKMLSEKAAALEPDSKSDDKKVSLKAMRDISNFNEISKYLTCSSKLLNALYNQGELLDTLIQKIPEFVPQIAQEITIMLKILKLIVDTPAANLDQIFYQVIELMRNFAKQSDDGTYLLSPLLSAAMASGDVNNVDFATIIQGDDVQKLDNCIYLNIK